MTAAGPPRSPLGAALGAVADWLIEPRPAVPVPPAPVVSGEPDALRAWNGAPAGDAAVPPRLVPARRPVVAVCGLERRSGVTAVARAVGSALAHRDVQGVAVVAGGDPLRSRPAGVSNAARLARRIGPSLGGGVAARGRLCLIGGHPPERVTEIVAGSYPVVLDVGDPAAAAAAATLADAVAIVAAATAEPALAAVVAAALARVGPPPVVVLNRAGADPGGWAGRHDARIREGRLALTLAAAGRAPRGGTAGDIAAVVAAIGA